MKKIRKGEYHIFLELEWNPHPAPRSVNTLIMAVSLSFGKRITGGS
jgi:hypothetical protein